MSTSVVIALRLVHVVIGAMWVGTVVFVAVFLLPTLRAIGPSGGAVMEHLTTVRRLPAFIMGMMGLTILSGLTLYWHDSAGFTSKVWLASGQARMLGLGAVLAIITAILGGTVNSPTADKLGKLMAQVRASGGPPSVEQSAELSRLRERLTKAINAAAVLLVLTVACMAVARYV